MLVDNPWQVRSIQAFSCLKCPECAFITKEENSFQTHAVRSHPLSYISYTSIFYERLNSNSESPKKKDEKYDTIKETSTKGKNIIYVSNSAFRHSSTVHEETNSSQVKDKTNEVENNLQESEISDDMIEIKNEPLDESIEQDPLQMGHPVTNTMGYPVTDSMGHPVIDTMGHPTTNIPIKQDPLQIETDTMRHPANMPMIKLQMGHPVTETMRHSVNETMGHPVTETMTHPITDPMAHPTNLQINETENLNEDMNTTSIPYHTFDNSSVKKRTVGKTGSRKTRSGGKPEVEKTGNGKRAYPFYVVCNPQKKIGTRNYLGNYSLSDSPVAQEGNKLYKCYECDKGFPDIDTFNKHYESVHEGGNP